MSRNIIVEDISHTPVERQYSEIVERKGIGHPDTISDAIAETVSRALSQMYLDRFGRILHHNTDEVQIVGGQSAPAFGGGVVLEPAKIILVGRATTEVNGDRLPFRSAAVKAAKEYLRRHCTQLDVDTDVTIDCLIGRGSVDLQGLYDTQKHLANDTSFGVSYAPLSATDRLVMGVEEFINGPLKEELPEVGHDIKVMGVRRGDSIRLTIAAAMVDRHIPDQDHYVSAIEELTDRVQDHAPQITDKNVTVNVNTGDNYDAGRFYLTVTGLSMENGDDGSVGRGNRVNGLITPYRPMSMEAVAGKNPVTHVGKLYNVLARELAQQIYEEAGGNIEEVHLRIVSQIGKPIDYPQAASAQLLMADGVHVSKVKDDVERLVDQGLSRISDLTMGFVKGDIRVY
ncbi:MAG: methionine adenosyltransferase [Thermoplasmata archaeon]